jgi:hypothetical protein
MDERHLGTSRLGLARRRSQHKPPGLDCEACSERNSSIFPRYSIDRPRSALPGSAPGACLVLGLGAQKSQAPGNLVGRRGVNRQVARHTLTVLRIDGDRTESARSAVLELRNLVLGHAPARGRGRPQCSPPSKQGPTKLRWLSGRSPANRRPRACRPMASDRGYLAGRQRLRGTRKPPRITELTDEHDAATKPTRTRGPYPPHTSRLARPCRAHAGRVARQGVPLGVASRSSNWWLGDWVRFGKN